jgi:large subunit ribosomal protein L17
MIHRRKGRKFNRTASHRKAMLSNLSVALIKNKKIRTTLAKAKELRMFIEPIITKSKKSYLVKDDKPEAAVHARRVINSFLNDRGAVKILFDEITPKVLDRNGGYTRVLKMGRRLGDGAELALIELVDYNIEQAKTDTAADTDEKDSKGTKGKKIKKAAKESEGTKKAADKKKTAAKKKTDTKKSEGTKKSKGSKKKEAAE